MPTYGYHCPSCDTEFEVFQRMSDASGADCPRCGAASRRVFFPAGIVFKGSGFYKTDSRRASTASVNGGGPAGGTPPASGDKGSANGKTGDTSGGGAAATAGEKAPAGGAAGTKQDGGGSAAGGTTTPRGRCSQRRC